MHKPAKFIIIFPNYSEQKPLNLQTPKHETTYCNLRYYWTKELAHLTSPHTQLCQEHAE